MTGNFVNSGASAVGVLPHYQPSAPGLWIDNGVLTFWNGTTNTVVDINDGGATDKDSWTTNQW